MSNMTRIHNDYYDPDRHMPDMEEGFRAEMEDRLKTALEKECTGRWDWDRITSCWTSKDSDLEPWGYQGLELTSVVFTGKTIDSGDLMAQIMVHGGKTFAGTDICMNIPDDLEDRILEQLREHYLEQAQEVMIGCNSEGSWDGDSWYMTYKNKIEVPLIMFEDPENDYEYTMNIEESAASCIEAGKADIKSWESEITLADEILNMLAGWSTRDQAGNIVSCPANKPGPECVYHNHPSINF